MTAFAWTETGRDGAARAGVLHTAHGTVDTPTFMPVGTAGTVKAMTADAVRATGAGIVLGNTYHLMLRPGAERIATVGRAAPVHGLARSDPDRFRRVPGDVAGQATARSTRTA